jgi:hypothetical protein
MHHVEGVAFQYSSGLVPRYPTWWGLEANDYRLATAFLVDRANIAHSLNKPIILEEIGLVVRLYV